jgi:hypothetical protein
VLFDVDPEAFFIAPSIYSGSPASGELFGQELFAEFLVIILGFDLQGIIHRTLGQIMPMLRYALAVCIFPGRRFLI